MVKRSKCLTALYSIVFYASLFHWSLIYAKSTSNTTTKDLFHMTLQETDSPVSIPDARKNQVVARTARSINDEAQSNELNTIWKSNKDDVNYPRQLTTSARSTGHRRLLRQFIRTFRFCPQCQTCPSSTPAYNTNATDSSLMCPKFPSCPMCPTFPTCPICPTQPSCPSINCAAIPPCPAIPACPAIPPCPAIPQCPATISSFDRISVCGLRASMAVSTANSGIIDVTYALGDSTCMIVLAAAIPTNTITVKCTSAIPGTNPTIANSAQSETLVTGTSFQRTGYAVISIPKPIIPNSQLKCSWQMT